MAVSARELNVQDFRVRLVDWRNLRKIDWMLPLLVLALACIGFMTIYSAAKNVDETMTLKQVAAFVMGAGIAAVIVCTDYRVFVALGPVIYLVMLAGLLAVMFGGYTARGAESWLNFGLFRVQPSEMSKVMLVYVLAWYFSRVGARIRSLFFFGLTFVIVGVPLYLILRQPDLGTALCFVPLTVGMLYVAGCRLWHLGVLVLLGLAGLPLLWIQMKDFDPDPKRREEVVAAGDWWHLKYHQKMRIYTFFHPEADPKGGAWQTIQSKIAVGSGGLSGKGYMQGTQTRLNYLPEHHTDFIFSQFAEERGFIGVAVVIGLFAALLFRGLMFARDCPEMEGTLLATGAVIILAFHVLVNIAITVGLLPVTGLPLPFMSYGRSFYITVMACIGILLSVPLRQQVFMDPMRPGGVPGRKGWR